MQSEQLSDGVELESAMSGGAAADWADEGAAEMDAPVPQPCDTVAAPSDTMPPASSATGKGVGQLLSIFKIAAEDQAHIYRDLNERMDRLEKTADAENLRETVRELFDVVTGLAGEMGRRISHAEHQITTVAKAVEALMEKFSVATEELKDLNLAAHEKLVPLHELLNAAEVRIDQVESTIAQLQQGDSKSLAAMGVLSKNLESFGDRLTQEETQTAQLDERLGLAESQIATIAAVETKVETLAARVSELGDVEKSLADLQETGTRVSGDMSALQERVVQAESGLAASAEKSQSLAKLHASLAETYAPHPG